MTESFEKHQRIPLHLETLFPFFKKKTDNLKFPACFSTCDILPHLIHLEIWLQPNGQNFGGENVRNPSGKGKKQQVMTVLIFALWPLKLHFWTSFSLDLTADHLYRLLTVYHRFTCKTGCLYQTSNKCLDIALCDIQSGV